MTIVNIQSNVQEKNQEEETYTIGDYFLLREGEGNVPALTILAQVDCGKITFVSLDKGNRWFDPIHVPDVHKITDKDISVLSGDQVGDYNIRFVKSVSISYSS